MDKTHWQANASSRHAAGCLQSAAWRNSPFTLAQGCDRATGRSMKRSFHAVAILFRTGAQHWRSMRRNWTAISSLDGDWCCTRARRPGLRRSRRMQRGYLRVAIAGLAAFDAVTAIGGAAAVLAVADRFPLAWLRATIFNHMHRSRADPGDRGRRLACCGRDDPASSQARHHRGAGGGRPDRGQSDRGDRAAQRRYADLLDPGAVPRDWPDDRRAGGPCVAGSRSPFSPPSRSPVADLAGARS